MQPVVYYTLDSPGTLYFVRYKMSWRARKSTENGDRWRLLALRGFVDVIHHTTALEYEDHRPLQSTYQNSIPQATPDLTRFPLWFNRWELIIAPVFSPSPLFEQVHYYYTVRSTPYTE